MVTNSLYICIGIWTAQEFSLLDSIQPGSAQPQLTSDTSRATAGDQCDDPLPDVMVSAPDPHLPKEFAVFSGIWRGK